MCCVGVTQIFDQFLTPGNCRALACSKIAFGEMVASCLAYKMVLVSSCSARGKHKRPVVKGRYVITGAAATPANIGASQPRQAYLQSNIRCSKRREVGAGVSGLQSSCSWKKLSEVLWLAN